jgi:PPOX class probable F420-dependent enzyme
VKEAVGELGSARYVSLTTFKRDGSAVATPVWITGSEGSYVFTTGDRAGKTRRLRHNASVQVQVCDMRGRVSPDAAIYMGTGTVQATAASVAAAEHAIAAKYGWQFNATKIVDGLKARFGRGPKQEVVAIHLELGSGPGS